MRKDRRKPFFTAVNIDGNSLFNFARGRDRWYYDWQQYEGGDAWGGEGAEHEGGTP